jgi:histidine kinase-like protein
VRGRVPVDVVEGAQLCVAELVVNALEFAPGRSYLTVEVGAGWLRVAVRDTNPNPPASTGGLGLRIVGAVADRFGVDAATTGKEVWCEFDSGLAACGQTEAASVVGLSCRAAGYRRRRAD